MHMKSEHMIHMKAKFEGLKSKRKIGKEKSDHLKSKKKKMKSEHLKSEMKIANAKSERPKSRKKRKQR